jgi:radical SAM superfamily enzyme YgiQ (UPF0313 family)
LYRRSKKVVFFFPAFSSTEATAPLGILAVSTPLLRAGYQVCLIDSTITPNFKKRVIEELADALCLCVSLVTGPMIRELVEIAKETKRFIRDAGGAGWMASVATADQTLAAEYVDVVVKGQGEDALLEIVERIDARESFEGIEGAGYKVDGPVGIQQAARAETAGGDAAESVSSCGFRRVLETVRAALDELHVEPGVSLQLFVLHQCGRVRTQVERAAGGTGVGGNGRLGERYRLSLAVGDRR